MRLQVGEDPGELGRPLGQGGGPRTQAIRGLLRLEVVHEHQPGGEVRVFTPRPGEDLADDADQHLVARGRELVDGPLRAPALLLPLGGDDPAVALERLDRVVERAEVQTDELVHVPLAHRRGQLVGVHRMLVQELEDRERQGRDLDRRL